MNNRQIDLQVIIRNLQNKILIQKEEAKIISDRYEQRIRAVEEESQRRLHQKQRMIEYLTLQLDKDRQLIMNEQYMYDSKRTRQRDEIYNQCERLKAKNTQLQKKLQGMIQKYELQKRDLENQIKKYQQKEYDESFSRASIEGQIQKLNKFYHQSRIDQPKRKQLVEWTEKLSILIDKTENQNSKALEQLFSFIKDNLNTFKTELLQSLEHASDFQEQILKNKKEILNNIKEIIHQETKVKNQMAQSNQKLYQHFKKQRTTAQSEKIAQLQRDLAQTRKKYSESSQQLLNRIKNLQNERKTLLLGFTQLKNLNQSREKTYKQEISTLKETIQSLLTTGEQRESQFEKQMKVLHNQLTSISERYYENIEVPLTKMTSKLDNQIKAARTELQKLTENRTFMKSIGDLEQIMQSYISENAHNSKINQQIYEYGKKTEDLVKLAQRITQGEHERQQLIKPEKLIESTKKENIDDLHGKINSIETNLKEVEWKERQNKLLYELNTAKKFNKKLKDHCAGLQQKGANADNRGVSPIKRGKTASSSVKSNPSVVKGDASVKLYELQTEIERLTLVNQSYEQEYLYQLGVIKQNLQKLTGRQLKEDKNLSTMQRGINELVQFNGKLKTIIQKQSTHMSSIREILSNLNKMLIKPVQIFDSFVSKITNCYQTPFMALTKQTNQYTLASSSNPFKHLQQVYKEMHSKRQQNNSQACRLLTDFIKLLRETAPNHSKNIQKNTSSAQQKEPLQRSRMGNRESGLERKIRDLQNMRIKSREEVIKKLQKIEETLKNIEAKYSKRHFASVSKIEESLAKRIDELRERCMEKIRQNNSEINEITGTVLKDIKNKLKLCMNQNEGLVKEVQLLQKYKKKQ